MQSDIQKHPHQKWAAPRIDGEPSARQFNAYFDLVGAELPEVAQVIQSVHRAAGRLDAKAAVRRSLDVAGTCRRRHAAPYKAPATRRRLMFAAGVFDSRRPQRNAWDKES